MTGVTSVGLQIVMHRNCHLLYSFLLWKALQRYFILSQDPRRWSSEAWMFCSTAWSDSQDAIWGAS